MSKLFFASNNNNKIIEIKKIIIDNLLDFEIVCPNDFNCKDEPIENGSSFKENSYIKAKFYYDKFHLPTIADDSGICIDFLDGQPGIHSARFKAELNYIEKNEYILQLLKDTSNRGAQFICNICYIDELGQISHFEGIQKGEIAYEQKGIEGFGYDPIFFLPKYGKTEAELGNEYKSKYSHRALALKGWINYVKK